MSRKYFGTDGVRGRVGETPMTVDFALRLASAAARVLAPSCGTVLIGKDTRLSGYMFEAALEAGFVAAGVNVQLIGPLPTPGIAYLTGEQEIRDPALAGFELRDVLKLDLKNLRQTLRLQNIGTLEIKKRGVEHDPEQVSQQLQLSGHESDTLFLTRLHDQPVAMIARRLA